MVSQWQTPIPLDEYTMNRVVVYFYSDNQWVPIKYCYLSKAISLYYQALLSSARELIIFPPDLDPNKFE